MIGLAQLRSETDRHAPQIAEQTPKMTFIEKFSPKGLVSRKTPNKPVNEARNLIIVVRSFKKIGARKVTKRTDE